MSLPGGTKHHFNNHGGRETAKTDDKTLRTRLQLQPLPGGGPHAQLAQGVQVLAVGQLALIVGQPDLRGVRGKKVI